MKYSTIKPFLIGLLACWALAGAVNASPLSDARDAGLIKELPNGFVATQGQVSSEIEAIAKEVNDRRREAYEEIAKRNNLTVEQVGQESYAKRYPN